jgi:hypothetical protein
MRIRIVANIDDAHTQRRVQIVKTFSSGDVLRKFIHVTYGMNEMLLWCWVVYKGLEGR